MRDDGRGMLDDPAGGRPSGVVRPDPPRFCPRCERPRSSHSGLCPECGDRLESQGYCTVCESFWPMPADAPCPKHEIPLVPDRPEAAPALADDEPIGWVTVAAYPLPFQAEAARLRLDAEAIPTLLDGHRMATNTAYHIAIGGIRLQVPRAFEQDARILLAQNWSVPADDDEDDEPDWDDLAPIRDDPAAWRSSLLFWGVVLVLLVVLGGLIGLVRS